MSLPGQSQAGVKAKRPARRRDETTGRWEWTVTEASLRAGHVNVENLVLMLGEVRCELLGECRVKFLLLRGALWVMLFVPFALPLVGQLHVGQGRRGGLLRKSPHRV